MLGGAYRGAITPVGYAAVSFYVFLSPTTFISQYGKAAHSDHPVVYLGSSAGDDKGNAGTDAGLIYGASQDGKWHFYLKAFGGPSTGDYSNITFNPGSNVAMFYYLENKGTGRSKKTLVNLSVVDQSEDFRTAHKAIVTAHHNSDFSNVKVKRNQQLAQTEKGADGKATKMQIRGVNIEKTGSYMTGFKWFNGNVWKPGEFTGHRWGVPDTAAIIKWRGSPNANVSARVLQANSNEIEVGVDLR